MYVRGRVYLAALETDERKPWIVVSNNGRNRGLGHALVVRVTTSSKYSQLDTVGRLPDGECVHGWVLGDSLTWIYGDDAAEEIGGLSRPAMRIVEATLPAALGM